MGKEYTSTIDNKKENKISSVDSGYEKIFNNAWNTNNTNIEVSIIIPSHNRYPLNLFSLYSLEKQAYDTTKMEVIFLDDASTDESYLIVEKYKPSFPFCYIYCKKNLGRAKIRNKGIEMARGKIIIFLDAEMIVEEDFVMNHDKHHEGNDKLVVTGAFHSKNVYTCFFPKFDAMQAATLRKLAKVDEELYIKCNYYRKITKNKSLQESSPFILFNKTEIQEKRYKLLVAKNYDFANEVLAIYGDQLKGFYFPWMAFLTGNVSVKKEFIEAVGGFDNEFIGYGYEDWELGYRLYKNGAKFITNKSVTTYHQEHPISRDKWNEAVVNYYLFVKKHPDVDVLVLGLELARIMDLQSMNSVLLEYKYLEEKYPNEFENFKKGFLKILETVAILLRYDIRHKFLFEASGINKHEKAGIFSDIQSMKKIDKFRQLTELFEHQLSQERNNIFKNIG
ncbi:glycosyltransferase family 2 protein [Clostridium formicaceticum]|uniref:Chondroitin synthase n=1 Tax=Clostridium formicaceticum TaxID=1497 RepID=A0AAC9RNJ9_9CLOT|nr:glycosyltransferase [Clostridium formicaceticum]AOY77824.1 hypothetical protein BJL90_19340 [Clostridium formicaceticum]ARE88435.1 Chondroitin synthase [Clostridium formicaceticum]